MIVKDRKSGKYVLIHKNNHDYYNRILNTMYGVGLYNTNICYYKIIQNKIREIYGV